MIIDEHLALGLFFVLLFFNSFTYYMMRAVIESIVWCDKGGKYNSLVKVKKSVGFCERLKMSYLKQYTNIHRKNFLFWLKCKRNFVIVELCATIIYIGCVFLIHFSIWVQVCMLFILLQAMVFALILFFQMDIHRNTKYDRKRELRKQKNKHL